MSMTTKREKLTITAETVQRTTIRWRRTLTVAWCNECAAQVSMLTTSEAAAIAHTTLRAIFRHVEAGELHFVESASGDLLVCRNSLESFAKGSQRDDEIVKCLSPNETKTPISTEERNKDYDCKTNRF